MSFFKKQFVVLFVAVGVFAAFGASYADAESVLYSNPNVNVVLTFVEPSLSNSGSDFGVQLYQYKDEQGFFPSTSTAYGFLKFDKRKPRLDIMYTPYERVVGVQATYQIFGKDGRLLNKYRTVWLRARHHIPLFPKGRRMLISAVVGLDDLSLEPQQSNAS